MTAGPGSARLLRESSTIATWEDLDSRDRPRRHARLHRSEAGAGLVHQAPHGGREELVAPEIPAAFSRPRLAVALLAKEPHIEATLKPFEERGFYVNDRHTTTAGFLSATCQRSPRRRAATSIISTRP